MKQIVLSILLLAISVASFAQNKIGLNSTILVGESKSIYEVRDMVMDSLGNKYLLGNFKGSINIGGNALNSNLSNHWEAKAYYLVKYDTNENFVWAKVIAQCDTLYRASLYIDKNDNLFVCYTFDGSLILQTKTIVGQGNNDCVISKLDSSANELFELQIGGPEVEAFSGQNVLDFDESNNFYLVASYHTSYSSFHQLVIGNDTLISNQIDILIVKFNSLGNTIWAKSLGGNGNDIGKGISILNNRIYVLGTLGNYFNNDIGGINFSTPQNYLVNGFIAQLDTSGNGIWARHFGSGSPDLLSILNPVDIKVSHNRVSFTALDFSNIQNVFYFQGGPTLTGSNQTDYVIATYDTLGNFKWNTISKSAGSEVISSLDFDSKGNLYSLGYHSYKIDFPTDTLYGMGGDDIHVVSYDSNGTYRFAFEAGGASGDIGNDIKINKQGEIYIVGGTTSNPCYMGNDTLYPPVGQSTLFYARIDSIANMSTSVQDFTTQDWSIYPNPVEDIINIQVANEKLNELEQITIYDMLGRQVKVKKTYNLKSDYIPINVSTLPQGIYIISLKTKETTSSRKIIKQ